jgi:hypothetical protein
LCLASARARGYRLLIKNSSQIADFYTDTGD